MRYIFPLLTFILLGCTSKPLTTASGSRNNSTPVVDPLPADIQKQIEKVFPDYAVVKGEDYIKAWWSFYDKSTVPYAVTVDISDDSKEDYGVLVRQGDRIKLIFLISNGGTYTTWLAPDFDKPIKDGQIHHGLSIVPPGQIDVASPEIKTLILKTNGIALMDYELRNRIYYRGENNKMQVFTMSKE